VAFLAQEGQNILDAWRNTGMAEPATMTEAAWCSLAGTGEDWALSTEVDGGGNAGVCVKTAAAGSQVAFEVRSPQGTFLGAGAALLFQVHPTGAPPAAIPGFPGLHLGRIDAQLPIGALPASGVSASLAIPAGVAGFTLRTQALVVSPLAKNRFYAATAAHHVVLR
jgi:hypothetical protein